MNVVGVLNQHLACSACHSHAGWDRVSRPKPRQNSTIHELQCARCRARIAAKVPRPNDATSWRYRLVQREFRTLTTLQTAFAQDDQYGTVVPLGWFDGIMVTRWFGGLGMARHVRTLDAERALDAYRCAGEWLRRLHEANPDGYTACAVDVDDKLATLADSYGDALRAATGVVAGWDLLRNRAAAVGAHPVRTTWNHGDFKPENLLCDGRRYVGLDIHLQFAAPVVLDMASFLDHAWLAGPTFIRTRRHHDFRSLEAAFLRGYGELGEYGMAALRWAELYFALSYLGRDGQRGALQARLANLRMRPLIRILAEQLRDTV